METRSTEKAERPDHQEPEPATSAGVDFLRAIVAEDIRSGKHTTIVTRFPPEPNGYLHIGHAKSIVLNFGIAQEFGGRCHLRFDDTNPETEDAHYVEAIIDAVRWLGFDWGEHLYFASDYFEQMYLFAEHLIREGKAYVDSLSEDEIREYRGTITEPGKESPYRNRSVEENLSLFRRMRAGEFPDGAHVLRAKIDMASPNMLMRDPILYRIRHARHYRTGDRWCIYPMYDYAHPLEDALECVTHSICTLEFANNRELYDWVIENTPVPCRPRQYEFARLNLDYTVMSKRKLLALVEGGYVSGWDDPRLPTIAGLRRRGVTPEAVRAFCEMIGVARVESRVDMGKLEFAIRDDLNQKALRVLCVLRPLRVVITNYPEGQTEWIDAPYFPHDVPKPGSRKVPFSRVIYIERDDFMEHPPAGYHRLAPGREVRLRHAYIIRCDEVVKNDAGEIVELRCTYDPDSRGPGARSVKGTIHWVSAEHALPCEVRLYDRLFTVPDPEAAAAETGQDFTAFLNPESLVVVRGAFIEPSVKDDPPETRYQFERLGYFWPDPVDSRPDALVFNRTVTLRDTWAARMAAKATESQAAPPRAERAAPPPPPTPRTPPAATRPPRSPELEARERRYIEELGLPAEHADLLTRDLAVSDLYEAALRTGAPPRDLANWIINELPRELRGRSIPELPFGGAELGALVLLVENGTVSTTAAREVLAELAEKGGDPAEIVDRKGLRQISDPAVLGPIVEAVIDANPSKVDEYRRGRTGLLGFFVGQVMRATNGRANPEVVRQIFENRVDTAGRRLEPPAG